MGAGVLSASLAALAAETTSAHTAPGQANTFGSSWQEADGYGINLADSRVQEWSVSTLWWNPPVGGFDDVVDFSLEALYEPTDLVVNRASRNTLQDVLYVPIWSIGDGTPLGRTECYRGVAAMWGSHPHRVCDVKVIWVSMSQWATLNVLQQKYVAAHEFGHELGLRHSNQVNQGVNAAGTLVGTYHPAPTQTVMMTFGFGSLQLHAADAANVNLHY